MPIIVIMAPSTGTSMPRSTTTLTSAWLSSLLACHDPMASFPRRSQRKLADGHESRSSALANTCCHSSTPKSGRPRWESGPNNPCRRTARSRRIARRRRGELDAAVGIGDHHRAFLDEAHRSEREPGVTAHIEGTAGQLQRHGSCAGLNVHGGCGHARARFLPFDQTSERREQLDRRRCDGEVEPRHRERKGIDHRQRREGRGAEHPSLGGGLGRNDGHDLLPTDAADPHSSSNASSMRSIRAAKLAFRFSRRFLTTATRS